MLVSDIPVLQNKYDNSSNRISEAEIALYKVRRDDALRLMQLKSAEIWAELVFSLSRTYRLFTFPCFKSCLTLIYH